MKKLISSAGGVFGVLLGTIAFLALLNGIINFKSYFGEAIMVFQNTTRPLWGAILFWLPFEAPDTLKDYLTMGIITSGMRFRSSLYKWHAVENGVWSEFIIPIPFSRDRISVHKGEGKKFYRLFLPIYSFSELLFWPISILTNTLHSVSGRSDRNYDGKEWDNKEQKYISKNQYRLFFQPLTLAMIIIFIYYMVIFT